MHCEGTGSPAVVLIAGLPDRGESSWETSESGSKNPTIFSAVSQFTKVCDYDRPGTIQISHEKILTSKSTAVPQPTTAGDDVNDLHALVAAANIKKPFIIVAHSAGGLAARLYAMKYPEDVSALILIDVTNEFLYKEWSAQEIEIFKYAVKASHKQLASEYKDVEYKDFDKSFALLDQYNDHKLPIPAVVLVAGKAPDVKQIVKMGIWPKYVTQEMAASIIKGIHRANLHVIETFDPVATLINVENSGHYIQKEQPALVIELIKDMVEHERTNVR